MWATNPTFGVGVGQYYLWSDSFSSPELLASYSRSYPHNQFVLVGTEMGIVGLGAFLGLLGIVLWRAGQTLRLTRFQPLLLGAASGLAAFLITCLTGQPLLVNSVAVPFWMTLGLAAGVAGRTLTDTKSTYGPFSRTWRRWAVPLAVLLVLASAMPRAVAARQEVDFARLDYGLYAWESDAGGRRFRWMAGRSRFFAPVADAGVTIPLRAAGIGDVRPRVRIAVDGRVEKELTLSGSEWRTVIVSWSPSTNGGYRRIDLWAEPVWRPADVLQGSMDVRQLTVMVAEPVAIEHKGWVASLSTLHSLSRTEVRVIRTRPITVTQFLLDVIRFSWRSSGRTKN